MLPVRASDPPTMCGSSRVFYARGALQLTGAVGVGSESPCVDALEASGPGTPILVLLSHDADPTTTVQVRLYNSVIRLGGRQHHGSHQLLAPVL